MERVKKFYCSQPFYLIAPRPTSQSWIWYKDPLGD